MIPDFKTFIKESIWTDIQRRSAGDTVRKEDNVDFLDQDELFDYIKCHYKVTKFELDNDHKPINKKIKYQFHLLYLMRQAIMVFVCLWNSRKMKK